MGIRSFEELNVWKSSRELNKLMFQIIGSRQDINSGFLINHLFKTCGSIMDNIAEGFERDGNREFKQFLSVSKGSLGELRSQLYRALDINLINQSEFEQLLNHTIVIGKQLGAFIKYLKTSDYKGSKFSEPYYDYEG